MGLIRIGQMDGDGVGTTLHNIRVLNRPSVNRDTVDVGHSMISSE